MSTRGLSGDTLVRAGLLRAAVGMNGPVSSTTDATWDQWSEVATRERVVPLLYEVARQVGEALDGVHVEGVSETQVGVAALSVPIEQSLLQVADRLDDAGVPFAVLKGVATANIDYADPSHRQFGDVDLLVDPGDLGAAREALERKGWRQAYPRPGITGRSRTQ
jgi:Uncharacterised nucleotidyltransferase